MLTPPPKRTFPLPMDTLPLLQEQHFHLQKQPCLAYRNISTTYKNSSNTNNQEQHQNWKNTLPPSRTASPPTGTALALEQMAHPHLQEQLLTYRSSYLIFRHNFIITRNSSTPDSSVSYRNIANFKKSFPWQLAELFPKLLLQSMELFLKLKELFL